MCAYCISDKSHLIRRQCAQVMWALGMRVSAQGCREGQLCAQGRGQGREGAPVWHVPRRGQSQRAGRSRRSRRGAGRGAGGCSFHGSCCSSPALPCFCMAWLMVYTALPASERAAAPLPMQSSARATFLSMSPPNMSCMTCTAWAQGHEPRDLYGEQLRDLWVQYGCNNNKSNPSRDSACA